MKILKYIIIGVALFSSIKAEVKKYEKLLDYEDVTIRSVEKDGIRIMHKNGLTRIPIERLPEEVREELGMSMDGVDQHREMLHELRVEAAERARIIAANNEILAAAHMHIERATVFQVFGDGILVNVHATWDGTYKEVPIYRTVRGGTALRGYSNQRVKSGSRKEKNITRRDEWLIYISDDNSKLVNDSIFTGDVWEAGTFSYSNVFGETRTIPKYTTNSADIINR